jgi:hypothetical protein
MSDLNLSEMNHFTDEEIVLLEEMSEMLDDMTSDEVEDFIRMVEVMGEAKKKINFLLMDSSSFYH